MVAVSPEADRHRRGPLPGSRSQVKVLDGDGNPVAGASVTFTLTASTGSSACGTSSSSSAGSAAAASFAGGGAQASATSNASGIATSPALTANGDAGTFAASAALGELRRQRTARRHIHQQHRTGHIHPHKPRGQAREAHPRRRLHAIHSVGTAFPIRLAVTVTDAQKNPVPGALVTFSAPPPARADASRSAPASPATIAPASPHAHTVKVKTSACGIAVAPAFTASRQPGGYIVKASAKPARPAAFALVNEAP